MEMNEYINLIIDNLDVSYICSVMLLGYMITKSRLSTKIKIKTRWIIIPPCFLQLSQAVLFRH